MSNVSIEGADIHYEVRGTGEPLLLLHGFTGSGEGLAAPVRRRRAGAALPSDHPGRARPRPIDEPVGRVHPPASPRATCARCAISLGVARCKAVGLSMGGNTLLHLATQPPRPARGDGADRRAQLLPGAGARHHAHVHARIAQRAGVGGDAGPPRARRRPDPRAVANRRRRSPTATTTTWRSRRPTWRRSARAR